MTALPRSGPRAEPTSPTVQVAVRWSAGILHSEIPLDTRLADLSAVLASATRRVWELHPVCEWDEGVRP